jgi:hypothetical protein
MFGFHALAEIVPAPTDADVLAQILKLIGGVSGASALAIAVLVTQTLTVVFSSHWGDLLGKWKLLAIYGLAVISPVVTALASGTSLLAAVINGTVIAAVQVFVNEVIKHFKE